MEGNVAVKKRIKQVKNYSPKPLTEETKHFRKVQGDPVLSFKTKTTLLFGLICLGPYLYFLSTSELKEGVRTAISINVVMSGVGFFLTLGLIPVTSTYILRKDMFGLDINKQGSVAGSVRVPESLGLVAGIVFLTVTIMFQPFFFAHDHSWLTQYNAALMCICFMLFLGFVDDVLDIPWRVKLLLPSVAALPLLMAYTGHTTILIPKPLQPLFGVSLLELGLLYKIYMGLLAVFCTNSVNILAGINGLEVGQTVVIACAILTLNITRIGVKPVLTETEEDILQKEAHMFSIFLMQPLVGVSLGLLAYNWYPSSIFVGDTFTYFAGMALAVVGILGHFSETLLVFFLPQILNFLYSVPQLLKIVPCPRHRLPRYDPKTNLLIGSKDMNLVNLFLRTFGQCTEQALCVRLLIFQAVSCGFCFLLRRVLEGWYK